MSPRLRALLALSTLAFASACSKFASPSILGHWRAERFQVFSAQIPVGPEIVVSEKEISSPGTDVSMSVHGFETKSDEVTVDLDYGMGVTFYFDGPNRIFLKVPLIGKVYYRRVLDNAVVGAAASTVPVVVQPQPAAHAVPPVLVQSGAHDSGSAQSGQSTSVTVSVQSDIQLTSEPHVTDGRSVGELEMASIAAKQGQSDIAIDHLNNAFRAGFRDVARLNSSPEFASLGSDVRYQALVARYR